MVADSRRSSNRFNCFSVNFEFLVRLNPETRVLHKFTSAIMTASTPYVRKNEVSPVDLLEVIRYAYRTLGNFSAYLPLAPSNLLFNPFTMALLVASAWLLLYGYAGVEYRFMMPRLLQNSQKALLSNCNPLSNTRDFGTPNFVIIVLHTNFLISTSRMFANASTSAHLVK